MTVLGLQEDGDAHLRILNRCCSWTLRQPFSLISRFHSSCKFLRLHHHEIWRPYREETDSPTCGQRWGSTQPSSGSNVGHVASPRTPLEIWTAESVVGA